MQQKFALSSVEKNKIEKLLYKSEAGSNQWLLAQILLMRNAGVKFSQIAALLSISSNSAQYVVRRYLKLGLYQTFATTLINTKDAAFDEYSDVELDELEDDNVSFSDESSQQQYAKSQNTTSDSKQDSTFGIILKYSGQECPQVKTASLRKNSLSTTVLGYSGQECPEKWRSTSKQKSATPSFSHPTALEQSHGKEHYQNTNVSGDATSAPSHSNNSYVPSYSDMSSLLEIHPDVEHGFTYQNDSCTHLSTSSNENAGSGRKFKGLFSNFKNMFNRKDSNPFDVDLHNLNKQQSSNQAAFNPNATVFEDEVSSNNSEYFCQRSFNGSQGGAQDSFQDGSQDTGRFGFDNLWQAAQQPHTNYVVETDAQGKLKQDRFNHFENGAKPHHEQTDPQSSHSVKGRAQNFLSRNFKHSPLSVFSANSQPSAQPSLFPKMPDMQIPKPQMPSMPNMNSPYGESYDEPYDMSHDTAYSAELGMEQGSKFDRTPEFDGSSMYDRVPDFKKSSSYDGASEFDGTSKYKVTPEFDKPSMYDRALESDVTNKFTKLFKGILSNDPEPDTYSVADGFDENTLINGDDNSKTDYLYHNKVHLSSQQKDYLEHIVASSEERALDYSRWLKSKAILLCAQGYSNIQIAKILGLDHTRVSRIRSTFVQQGLDKLLNVTSDILSSPVYRNRVKGLILHLISKSPQEFGYKNTVWTGALIQDYLWRHCEELNMPDLLDMQGAYALRLIAQLIKEFPEQKFYIRKCDLQTPSDKEKDGIFEY